MRKRCVRPGSRILAFALLLALLLTGGAAVGQQSGDGTPVTVYLVRHAEKQEPASKPDTETPLSTEGQARAQKLAALLSGCSITVAYSTPYKRTIDTAKPLAERAGLTDSPIAIPPRELGSLPDRIRQFGARAVLVAGHGNTVPANARALAGREDVPDIADDAFFDLFVVTITQWEPRQATVQHFRYGSAPASAASLPEFTGCKP